MIQDIYIREACEDLRQPDYGFVRTALQDGRYNDITYALTCIGFFVVDDTEPNTDVCRTLIVTHDDLQALMMLSFAGPYSVLFSTYPLPSSQSLGD